VTFGFTLAQPGRARVRILNASGQLLSENSAGFGAGPAELVFDVKGFAQGVYYYQVNMDYDDGSTEILALKSFVVLNP
jgi:hypothetical protein